MGMRLQGFIKDSEMYARIQELAKDNSRSIARQVAILLEIGMSLYPKYEKIRLYAEEKKLPVMEVLQQVVVKGIESIK